MEFGSRIFRPTQVCLSSCNIVAKLSCQCVLIAVSIVFEGPGAGSSSCAAATCAICTIPNSPLCCNVFLISGLSMV